MSAPIVRKGKLIVYLLGHRVGALDYCSHRNEMHFAYDADYLAGSEPMPLSQSLPLQSEPFDSEVTTVFFENLLPPDPVRKKLGPVLHLSHHNIFGFLEALGGDCAGAISLWPEKSGPAEDGEKLMPLDEDGADEVLKSLKKRPLYINGVDGYRISGAGAQHKLIARIDAKGVISLPLFGTPSTHILKPAIEEYPDSVYNEFFSMRLAAKLGLATAEAGLMRVKDSVYYWTKRFDREFVDGRVRRLHQEDFCQILGVEAEMKYESEGGPSFKSVMTAINEMRLGLVHQFAFIDRMIFNFLIGNADAHGKNTSILYRGGKITLAPIYDVMSTAIYPNLSKVNAMTIGGAKRFDKVSRGSFAAMAREVGMNEDLLLGRLDNLARRILPAAEALAEELSAEWPSEVYRRIIDVIALQKSRISYVDRYQNEGFIRESGS